LPLGFLTEIVLMVVEGYKLQSFLLHTSLYLPIKFELVSFSTILSNDYYCEAYSPAPNIEAVLHVCEVLNVRYLDWGILWFLSVPLANFRIEL